MRYLIIKKGQGYYLNKESEENKIDNIGKDDILYLLREATKSDGEFEMDQVNNDEIRNEAQRIIYVHLYNKFKELLKNKNKFVDESRELYKDAFFKYR